VLQTSAKQWQKSCHVSNVIKLIILEFKSDDISADILF
jgi:hypothetical protein